ncbi:NXPE family member 3-like [Lytechinus variegatus]|uniref:NXPE family member 3-like n=1 Tax=Lytechinus variegatus TaxID=7654 RepID=UPI001BB22854|nr:NXPE family member 3-like [Lytechinus variegatus]
MAKDNQPYKKHRIFFILLCLALITCLLVYIKVNSKWKVPAPEKMSSGNPRNIHPSPKTLVGISTTPGFVESTKITKKGLSPTSNVFSTVEVINAKTSYQVNDSLHLRITARDINNVTKSHGGDYFRVKLYTAETQSSLSIDVTKDLGNGTYIADVTLRWPGMVDIIVTLVHPSEAVKVLQRIRDIYPGRMIFKGRYLRTLDSGTDVFEDKMCLPRVIRNETLCNFTDERTGYPWFCVAPSNRNLTCDDWQSYVVDPRLCEKYAMEAVTKAEFKMLKIHKLPIKESPPPLKVIGDHSSWKKSVFAYQDSLPSCKPGQHLHNPTPSGFYAKNIWFSDQCKFRRFTKPDVLQCLQNRAVHIFGDSTSRQMYLEFVKKYNSEIKQEHIKADFTENAIGPTHAKSSKFNISIHFKFHGSPVRQSTFIRKEAISYIANDLDDLTVDSRTVVLICVGTHFTTYPLAMYEERIRGIKAAVQRLHKRSPQTLVIFKSANTRNYKKILYQMENSEWYVRSLDRTMRAILQDCPEIGIIDAWDMTIAQNFKDAIHPNDAVLSNIMNNFLSYICPEEPNSS